MTPDIIIRTRPARRCAAIALAALALAACSFGPLGQADTPTTAPAPTSVPVTSAPATDAPDATAAPAEPTIALSSEKPSGERPAGAQQLTGITGKFSYTNDIITTYYVEHAAALIDMYAFIQRDKEWEVPIDSQVLGFMKLDETTKSGEYRIQLPQLPRAQFVDVNHDGKQDAGVQVFSTTYWPNAVAGPYSEGDDQSFGWPNYLASTVIDTENEDEVIGGKLVVWSPDDKQQFPTEFGPDGKLFTNDDPVGPIPAGYSVLDLDKKPFAISQEPTQNLTLYEPNDVAIKDFSKLSYSEAFKQMITILRKEYAFNGITGKGPDWDALDREFTPRVAEAESKRDAVAFSAALHDFTLQFHDGHVGVGEDPNVSLLFRQQAGGGYGFIGHELDDGRFIVTYVLEGGPAAQAGMAVGDEVTAFSDKPIKQAIGEVTPFEGPFSTDFGLRTAQARYLVRAPVDTATSVTFVNPGKPAAAARLTAVQEFESYLQALPARTSDPATLPVEARTLESGIGYIKVNSNYDDLGLIIRLFQRALKTFQDNKAPALIIDERINPGGAPLGLAGFLTDQEIPLGQTQYYSEKTGKFEPEGQPDKVRANEEQYKFDKIALLVDQNCTSACEIESYGFSKVPGVIVVGQYPSGGVEAEVARGQFQMPEGIKLQFPTGRIVLPDGSLFLEGKGVQPTVRVPIDEKSVLSSDDVVLKAAEAALTK
ncbi:MAG: S41 family peptidase [Chloroflexota bacterium]|nr:S41 family peptidase [Chloroflexota bacterium]